MSELGDRLQAGFGTAVTEVVDSRAWSRYAGLGASVRRRGERRRRRRQTAASVAGVVAAVAVAVAASRA